MSIKNVLICGLGAIGMTIGSKILANKDICLKVLVDEKRLKNFQKNQPTLNGDVKIFDYITEKDEFNSDLIIISTKMTGLKSVLNTLSKFINNENIIIISLINGISSEEIIKKSYPNVRVLKSYFIGHSAVRTGNSVTQDGVGEIVCEKNDDLAYFFQKVKINYSNPENIEYSMWLKYTLNLIANQVSAILNMNFGELKNNKEFKEFASDIIKEVKTVANRQGVCGLENLEPDTFEFLSRMCDDGKTSMLQDILANRKTEVDIFSGEIIRLGKSLGIDTPYNSALYHLIKIKEELNEYRIHTG